MNIDHTNQDKSNKPITEKKKWNKPELIVISTGYIQSGREPNGVEGQPTNGAIGFPPYSFTSRYHS
jgi:hypothetical protein